MPTDPIQIANFDKTQDTRHLPNTEIDILKFGSNEVNRVQFQPDWQWSVDVKPTAGTDSCQVAHLLIVLVGRMEITMDSGEKQVIGTHDVAYIAPGHDAKNIGDRPFVAIDVPDLAGFGKPS